MFPSVFPVRVLGNLGRTGFPIVLSRFVLMAIHLLQEESVLRYSAPHSTNVFFVPMCQVGSRRLRSLISMLIVCPPTSFPVPGSISVLPARLLATMIGGHVVRGLPTREASQARTVVTLRTCIMIITMANGRRESDP